MNNICNHCLKKMSSKYETKKIKTKCGHYKKYHYHCFMEISKNIKNEYGEMCCFHCKMIEDKFEPIEFVKFSHKNIVIKRIIFLTQIWHTEHKTQFDKILLLKKIFCIIENNIDYFLVNKKFCLTLDKKIDELLVVIEKKPNYDIGINIKAQGLYLKKLIKKI